MTRFGPRARAASLAAIVLLAAQGVQAGTYYTQGASVVRIRIAGTLKTPPKDRSIDYEEFATGFVVSNDGLVLSAGHIIPSADLFVEGRYTLEAMFPRLQSGAMAVIDPAVPLTLVKATTAADDVSLLRLADASSSRPLLMCDAAEPGQPLRVLGYPAGEPVLEMGPGLMRKPAFQHQPMVMSTPINPGDSGAPVFNDADFVIGIALGGPSEQGARQEGRTFALPIRYALDAVAPELDAARAMNYANDCHAVPATRPTQTSLAAQEVRGGGSTSLGTAQLLAPKGFRFVAVLAAKGVALMQDQRLPFTPKVSVAVPSDNVRLSNDGASATVEFDSAQLRNGPLLNYIVPVELQPSAPPDSGRIQAFHLSRLQDAHEVNVTRRSYTDVFEAPSGFVFEEVLRFTEISRNHVPMLAPPQISEDRRSVTIRYAIESGPFYDRWRGWLDATVGMKLRAVP